MPNVQPAVDAFIRDIERLEKKFEKDLDKLVIRLKKMSDTELIVASRELNFFQELIDKGYGKSLDNFESSYNEMLSAAIAEAKSRGIPVLAGASVESLEVLKDIDFERLLGRANIYSNELQTQLFRGIFGASSTKQITDSLLGTRLASHQLNVIAYDGLKIFDDMARYKTFQGQDVRWTYIGPQDANTRDECRATKDNEPKKGYTESEVGSSDTPFGIRGGFNCRHSWQIR